MSLVLEGVGSVERDHPFGRRISARGLNRGHHSPGSGKPVATRLAGWVESWKGLRLEDGPLGHNAVRHVSPERHEKLAGQRHDRDPPNPATPLADPLHEPAAEC